MAVAVALNHRTKPSSSSSSPAWSYSPFGPEEERMMVNVCVQCSEALDNLYRRPEEHNSFEQNAQALTVHAEAAVRHVLA